MPEYRSTQKQLPGSWEIRMTGGEDRIEILEGETHFAWTDMQALVNTGYFEEVPGPKRIIGTAVSNLMRNEIVEVDLIQGKVHVWGTGPLRDGAEGTSKMTMGSGARPGDVLYIDDKTGKLVSE